VNSGEAYLCLADDAQGLATPECMVCPEVHSFSLLVSAYAGDQWRLVSEGVYTHALPAGVNSAAEDGFTIRLSVYPALADEVLRRIVPIIVSAGCPFKVIANSPLLELVFSRGSSLDSAPDFMTVYPASHELFEELTAKLREATQEIKNSYKPIAPNKKSERVPLTPEAPWPGLNFFLSNESSYFCGRQEEQLELAQRLERSPLTVMLGRQSVGKSSLLRAGMAPTFERMRFEPVYVHLQCTGQTHPLQQVREEINRVLRERQIEGAPFGEGQSLREYFYQPEPFWIAKDKNPVVPVLVFDQFGDVLKTDNPGPTISRQLEVFWTQLANLVENRTREGIGQLKRSNVGGERLGCKVVISLGQEHLASLNERAGQFPSIARNHVSIKPLLGQKAVEAVLGPGRKLFDSANSDGLAEEIVRRVAREFPLSETETANNGVTDAIEHLTVEPSLLSFFCQQLNEARQSSTEPRLITSKLIEDESERAIENYFRLTGKKRTAGPIKKEHIAEREAIQETREPIASAPLPEPSRIESVPAQVQRTIEPPVREKEEAVEALASATVPELKESLPQAIPPQATVLEEHPIVVEARQAAPISESSETLPPPRRSETKALTESEPAPVSVPEFKYPSKEALLARLEQQEREKAQTASAPVVAFPERAPHLAQPEGNLVKRLRLLAYGLTALMAVFLAVLVVLYVQQVQKQQTELALQEYVSNLASTKNTINSANKKLTLAEKDIALKESNIQALAKSTREKEAEAQSAKEQNLKLEGEQTNYQSRIIELNREKTQAEARLAQWTGLVNELTNQIAILSKQRQEARPTNKVVTITNSVTITNFVETRLPDTSAAKESQAAAAMEGYPVQLPGSPVPSSRRQVDVLLTNGLCLYSEDGAKFHKLRARDVLYEGAIIRTGPASWSDFFIRRTGTTVRLAPDSQIKFVKLSEESQNGVTVMDSLMELQAGRIFTVVRALVPGSTLEISDASGHSVIEAGGLGSYMISAPTNSADKLALTPLRVVSQIGTSIIAPGQTYNAKDSAALSLVPSSWETMLIQLDELEAETDKAIAEPQHSASAKQK
jgi:hypothetical protein